MAQTRPFVLIDDAREEGAGDALLFEDPAELFVARRPDEVRAVLDAAEAARRERGGTLAGYLGYEAGLALEERLASRAPARSGAGGPLVWFGRFEGGQRIAAAEVSGWLAVRGGEAAASIGPLAPTLSPGTYLEAFDRLQEAIRAGEIYQANLTMQLAGAAEGDPVALYSAIRPAAKAGHGALVFDGSHWLLSFSPELFFTLDGRALTTRPMKGTRPRGRDAAEDRALAAELAASVKDKAENLMIVDLMRNDLSRVAAPGSVRVEQEFAVESYPTVHAMVSTVRAELGAGPGAMDVLKALFPCGSITGAPKIRAMEWIDAVEADARGPYCGAIGWIGPDSDGSRGSAAFNVAIRTIHLTPGENERHRAVLGVGGAVVADSDGLCEWRECLVKGGFARSAAGGHDLIETMRFEPGAGVALLASHLDRLEASAAEVGFACDRALLVQQLQALCSGLRQPARVRLLLSRSGAVTLESAPLPPRLPDPAPCLALPLPVSPSDWRLRHKTSDRHFYDSALAAAQEHGAIEAVLVRPDGLVTEGTFTNLYVERDGRLLTPPGALGLLPGVGRRELIEEKRAVEAELTVDDLTSGFWIGNAVRGLTRAVLVQP